VFESASAARDTARENVDTGCREKREMVADSVVTHVLS